MRYRFLFVVLVAGCGQFADAPKNAAQQTPPGFFPLALYISEYPSWGAFATATDMGLIDGRPGLVGALEKKYKVDLNVKLRPYDTCMSEYGSRGGAVCITNVDIVGLANGRPSTAILPTSTSAGADACTVIGINTLEDLKKTEVFGLEKSVSDFAFVRCIEAMGFRPSDFQFKNRDPEAGAQALQSNRIQAAMLWQPFIIQTLKTQPKSSVLFDTTKIVGEVVDMVCVDTATLQKPEGRAAAQCIVDAYYAVCESLQNPKTSEEAYASLKDRFAPNLTVDEMRSICQLGEGEVGHKTRFYSTPAEGRVVFEKDYMSPIMDKVLKWARDRQTVEGDLSIGYDEAQSQPLVFDSSFMSSVK